MAYELSENQAGTTEGGTAALLFNDSYSAGPGAGQRLSKPTSSDASSSSAVMAKFPDAADFSFCSADAATNGPEDAFRAAADSATIRRNGDQVTATLPAATHIATPGEAVEGVHLARTISANVSDQNGTLTLSNIQGITLGGANDWITYGLSQVSLTGDQLTVSAGFGIHFNFNVDLGQGGGAEFRAELRRRGVIR